MKLVTLKSAIDHKPQADDFEVIEAAAPACPEGGVLARAIYVSLDPYVGSRIRGRHMGETPPEPMKEAIPGAVVAQIEESASDKFSKGDYIHSMHGGWQELVVLKADQCRKIDPEAAPLSAHAGLLGMPGLTAWAGITQLANVGDNDIVLVDAAAGPVGGSVGQIARLKGASRVVGIAGGPEKCALVREKYGFDACIDYKSDGWREELGKALPDGLTVFFENVSADMAMIALSHAQTYARGVLCGLVDAYHNEEQSAHPLNAGLIIGKRANVMGLVVYDFYPRWDEFVLEATPWITSGKLKIAEDMANGLEQAPALFEKLMNGRNVGKCLVKVGEETP